MFDIFTSAGVHNEACADHFLPTGGLPGETEALAKDKGPVISVNDFHLIRVIGRGSYAKVFMVELKKTGRLYAMKVIKKELVSDDEVIA